VEAVV